MGRKEKRPFAPGTSVLGGAAGGLSYEGMMRDAVALEERERRWRAGRSRGLLHTLGQVQVQVQAPRSEAAQASQARVAGG